MTMRIAVTYDNGQIVQHFGRTEYFNVYEITEGKVTDSRIISTNGQGHSALIPVLEQLQVDIVICGGLGMPMKNAIESLGIQLINGVTGDADAAVAAYLAGTLHSNPDAVHNCHGEHH